MVLDGAMVILACFLLTVFHPALCFGGLWDAANFYFRTKKVVDGGVVEQKPKKAGFFGKKRIGEKSPAVQESASASESV